MYITESLAFLQQRLAQHCKLTMLLNFFKKFKKRKEGRQQEYSWEYYHVTAVQFYWGLLEKSVIYISDLSNLRGQGAFIHQLPFIAGREWLLEALIPAGHVSIHAPHPCSPTMLQWNRVQWPEMSHRESWVSAVRLHQRTQGQGLLIGYVRALTASATQQISIKEKPFLWQALFGANLWCSLEFKK